MQENTWPATDYYGVPWPRKSYRNRYKGEKLFGDYMMIAAEILGDWKWLKECFRLPQWYGKLDCCHKCVARKKLGVNSFTNFLEELPERSHDDFMSWFEDKVVPGLVRIHGFHLPRAMAD